jgi:broad-specificity NMP kinase
VITGAPGAGKTACLTALSDSLVDHEVAHAAIDVDEVAWSYPHPDNHERFVHLKACADSHRRAGQELLLVAECVESPAHLAGLLTAVGADDHLLVRLDALPGTLRARIEAREPPGWFGLDYLLGYAERSPAMLATVEAGLVLDTEKLTPAESAERIRAALGR